MSRQRLSRASAPLLLSCALLFFTFTPLTLPLSAATRPLHRRHVALPIAQIPMCRAGFHVHRRHSFATAKRGVDAPGSRRNNAPGDRKSEPGPTRNAGRSAQNTVPKSIRSIAFSQAGKPPFQAQNPLPLPLKGAQGKQKSPASEEAGPMIRQDQSPLRRDQIRLKPSSPSTLTSDA